MSHLTHSTYHHQQAVDSEPPPGRSAQGVDCVALAATTVASAGSLLTCAVL
jgi:hypothetical protein